MKHGTTRAGVTAVGLLLAAGSMLHAASQEATPPRVVIVERAMRLEIADVGQTFRVGEALPFLQQNSRYVIGILPARGSQPARAVALSVRPRLPVWFTDDNEMRFGYETKSTTGYLELAAGERLPIVGQNEKDWIVRVGQTKRPVDLPLPKNKRDIRIENEKPTPPKSLVLKLPNPDKPTPPPSTPGTKPAPTEGPKTVTSGPATPKVPTLPTPTGEPPAPPKAVAGTPWGTQKKSASAESPDEPKTPSALSAWITDVRIDWKRLVAESLIFSLPIPFLMALWGLIRVRRTQRARAPARPAKERRKKKVKEPSTPKPSASTPPASSTPAAPAIKKVQPKMAPLAGAPARPSLAPPAPAPLLSAPGKVESTVQKTQTVPPAPAPLLHAPGKVESTVRKTLVVPPTKDPNPAHSSAGSTLVKTILPETPKANDPLTTSSKSTVHRNLITTSQKARAHGELLPQEAPQPELTAPVYYQPEAEEKVARKTIHPKIKLVVQSEVLKTRAPGMPPPRTATPPVLVESTDEELMTRMASLRRPTQGGFDTEEAKNETSQTTVARPRAPTAATGAPIADIGPYQILERIGQGSAGVVYKAFQPDLQRVVALKLLLGGQHADPDQKERFLREARALAKLRHPNIVTVFEVGEHAGQPYISMEYVAGPTLDALIAGVPRKREEILTLVIPLVDALHYAHRQGIIHRDLKPGNILLTADHQPVITDFGLARNLEEQMRSVSGDIVGTPSYMPPEQAMGKTAETDVRSDVYSMGAILYALLTGKEPFKGATLLETLTAVIRDELMPPDLVCPTADKNIAAICEKAMRKDPASRYQSAGEMLSMLRSCL